MPINNVIGKPSMPASSAQAVVTSDEPASGGSGPKVNPNNVTAPAPMSIDDATDAFFNGDLEMSPEDKKDAQKATKKAGKAAKVEVEEDEADDDFFSGTAASAQVEEESTGEGEDDSAAGDSAELTEQQFERLSTIKASPRTVASLMAMDPKAREAAISMAEDAYTSAGGSNKKSTPEQKAVEVTDEEIERQIPASDAMIDGLSTILNCDAENAKEAFKLIRNAIAKPLLMQQVQIAGHIVREAQNTEAQAIKATLDTIYNTVKVRIPEISNRATFDKLVKDGRVAAIANVHANNGMPKLEAITQAIKETILVHYPRSALVQSGQSVNRQTVASGQGRRSPLSGKDSRVKVATQNNTAPSLDAMMDAVFDNMIKKA